MRGCGTLLIGREALQDSGSVPSPMKQPGLLSDVLRIKCNVLGPSQPLYNAVLDRT